MNASVIIFVVLILVPLLSLVAPDSDHDDRDRRGWWPGARAR